MTFDDTDEPTAAEVLIRESIASAKDIPGATEEIDRQLEKFDTMSSDQKRSVYEWTLRLAIGATMKAAAHDPGVLKELARRREA